MIKFSPIITLLILLLPGIEVSSSPFSQFAITSNTNCSTDEYYGCADIVFLVDIGSAISADYARLIELADQLPNGSYNCTHRYGLTVFGLSDVITIVLFNGTSYFGTVTQLNTVLLAYSSQTTDTITNKLVTAYEGLNRALETYLFREGVQRKIVLIANEPRNVTSSSTQHTYENTLLNILQNRITLSVLTTGVRYFDTKGDRLVGINFNKRVGFGQFSKTICSTSNNLYLTTDTHYIVQSGYEWNYRSYVQLAWNTNGSSYDLSYFNSQTSSYCSVRAARIFSYGTFRAADCILQDNIFSYSSEISTNSYFTTWTDIAARETSSCVDMVFLLDRTGSMNSYFDSIQNLSSLLPENGDNCTNRYGLTLFHDVVEILTLGSSYWGTPSELSNAFGFTRTGATEDGFLGIYYILKYYNFRNDVKKHIVLFTDEPRSIVNSTLTISSVTSLLKQNDIIFSIVSNAEDFYYKTSSFSSSYLEATVQYSNTIIGFESLGSSTPITVNAYSPAYYTLHNSNQHNNYVELAWSTGGVAYNLDFFKSSSYYAGNSFLFNTLIFSFQESVEYFLFSIGTSAVGVRNNILHYTFHCQTNTVSNTSISLILDGTWYTVNDASYISVTAGLWDTTPGEYNFICLASNGISGNVWLGTFIVYELPISPFLLFSPYFVPDYEELTCDSYELTGCIDLIFIIDTSVLTANNSLTRIAAFAGSLEQSTLNCTNRYGLTVFGNNIGISIVNLTVDSVYGTPSQLQTALSTNLIQGSAVASADGYIAIHEAIRRYHFRSGVQRKILLITDQLLGTTSAYTYEETLLTLLINDIVLSVITNVDMYSTSLLDRIIGMSGSNRLGYGNYSHCSPTAAQDISTVFNAQYTTRSNTEHHEYVELAWFSGGASYDLNYFEVSTAQFCANLITDVFSFATLADTPCSLNGAVYSYSDKVILPLYTQWKEIDPHQVSSCVDMLFVVDRTGSMGSYYSAIDNIANNLPYNGDSCQNRYGLTIFKDYATRLTVGGSSSYWGSPSELYTSLNSFSTSGSREDGLLAIDYAIDEYTFRSDVVKHIVLFADEPRAILDSTITNSTVISKLENAGIILSVVTVADSFYSLSSTVDYLLAGVLLSQSLIGFGDNINNDTQIDSYSPSAYTIHDSNAHENYIEVAWQTGGVAFDLSYYSGSSYYRETSAVFNKLLFSYRTSSNFSIPHSFEPVEIISTDVLTKFTTNYIEYQFSCTAASSPDLSLSLLIDGEWYTNSSSNYSSTSIQVILPLSHLSVGMYYFLCVANSSLGSDTSVDNYTIIELPTSPFLQFSPNNIPDYEELTCDSYELTGCIDLIFIIDISVLTANNSLTRIAAFAGSLEQSTLNCTNRYGLTVFGNNIGISIVNLTVDSVYGTPSQLQTALNANLIQGSAVASADGYIAIHEAIRGYHFRSGVRRKILLITDQLLEITSAYTYEETLLTLLINDVVLSVITNVDTYSTSLLHRIIGMSGSNRLGYGNYSHCSPTAAQDISTVFNAHYTTRSNTEHHEYVELAWFSGGASYDLSYFEVSTAQFCANLITDVFSFATLADTPCSLNGAVYSYSDKVILPLYTQWKEIDPHQVSSCVDMLFVVDRTGSMSSYYSAIDNIANNLPYNGNSCQNRYGLTIFRDYATRLTVGGSSSYWGSPSELYTALNSFSTSGSREDGLLAIDYAIDEYTFRSDVVKHIVLFADEPRAILDSTITNSTVISKLWNAGIILSVVTVADSFYTLSSTVDYLLAGILLSQNLIGFGDNINNDTQIDSYSPSAYTIHDSNAHENYIEVAWQTGGVAFDLSYYSGSSYYRETSAVFNKLLFSYRTSSNFSIPHHFEPVEIISTEVLTNITTNYIEYQFSCTAASSPDLSLSLLIDGEWYTNSSSNYSSTSIQVILPLSHLSVGMYYFLCVANSSLGSDTSVDNYTIIEIPIYPFQQFTPDFKNTGAISCGNFNHTNCVDLVLVISLTQTLSDEMDRLLELIGSFPNSTNNCVNSFGLTLFGLSTGSLIVNVSTDSYFGTAQQLRTAIQQNQNIGLTLGAGVEDAYLGIHNALEKYEFRDGVKRRMVLVTKEPRQTSASTAQYSYEDTLTELLKNDVTLNLVSYGAQYTTESTQERLIGIIYNNRIGFGLYNENDCTRPLDPVLDAQYTVTNRDIYVSYNELAWSTNGAAFDISYFNSLHSKYCPRLLSDAFTFAIFSEATCEFYANTFTYGNMSTNGSYTTWTDINPQAFSNCVDMVFLVDRTASMNSYLPGIENIVSNLPTNGESCINRYGLTLFEDYSVAIYVGGGSKLFGTPSQLFSELSFSQLGYREDGILAIDYIIDNYRSSFRSDVQKHIILITDEPRTIVSSSTTKLSVLNKLNQAGIILSVITLANDFYYNNGTSNSYLMASIKVSSTVIGFANWVDLSDEIDAISPISLNTLDSNAHTNYVELAWETGGIAFDLYFCKYSKYYSRLSATYNKLMFSWGGRTNSSITATYAPVLVSAINSTVVSSSIGELIYNFSCVATSASTSNISMFIEGKWYSNEGANSIDNTIVFEYPYPHPGSYNFICVANSSIGGDQTLGVYTVPDTPRIYPQYSQFTYIPDRKIECNPIALQETHCMDLVVILDISAYTDAAVDRISSLAASLPVNASTCYNRYGLTLYGTSSLSQAIPLTSSPAQSYFSTPSDLSSAIKNQRSIASSLGSGSKDGYEAIHSVMRQYSFRENVQKKILLFSNEAREVAPSFSNLTFWSTIQTLLANKVTLNTVSDADSYYYFYNNTNNRLIGMHYNTRTGVGNYSSSCNHSIDYLTSIPSAEYTVERQREHRDYVELAWMSNGTAFDLGYLDKTTDYCSNLVDAVVLYAVIQNFPCTLDIVDYAFTSRTEFSTLSIWDNILPQVDTSCVDTVFLIDSSLPSSTFYNLLNNLIFNLIFNSYGCNHYYSGYWYTDGYDGIQYVIDYHGFGTDYIKSIVLITEQPRTIVETRYTKSSILSSLRTNGIILSVMTNAGNFYFDQSSPISLLAAVRISDTLIGFGNTRTNSTTVDAVSPASYNVSNSTIDNDYVDLAWQTGGVAFNIDLLSSSLSAVTHFATLMFIWGDPDPIKIISMEVRSQGTLSSPGPYEFTCTINSVPHATLTLVVQGASYVATDTTSITQVLTLSDLTPDTYQYVCSASNSNGGDTQRNLFTTWEPIPSPFAQFAFTPDAGDSCNSFELTTCVDLIFLLDISGSINTELNRIAELAGNLPNASGTCENRYGLTLFALSDDAIVFNLSTDSLYGTPAQLKSVILSSRNIGSTVGYGPEDGYPAIHLALSTFSFREGVERRLVLFADEPRSTDSTTRHYTYENTISLLFQYQIKLTAVTYSGYIYHYTRESTNRLIGMNFFSNIGFGNFSSTNTEVNAVPNPYFSTNEVNTYQSYVSLAFDTHGTVFDMRYLYQYNTPYSPTLIANLFEFAVIGDAPCQLNDVAFNFDTRTLTSSTSYYSEWTQITPQVESNCVDMIFLVDRTGSFRSYVPGVTNVAKYLPEYGDGCINRYGLVSFERTAIIFNLTNTSNFGTASQLYGELTSFSLSGGTEDAYVGINAIVNEFEFRDSVHVRKHIILFTDEYRSVVNSSLTKSRILQSLEDNGIILTAVTDAAYFYKPSSTTKLNAAALVSDSQIGFMVTSEQNVNAYSPMDLTIRSSSLYRDYVDLAWKTGGVAFDLTYFTNSYNNLKSVVTSFNTLMFSWGTFVPIQLDSSSSAGNNELIIECSINSVPNVSISLIVGEERYTDSNANSLRTSFSTWNSTSFSYVCLANNSISGDSHIKPLDIIIPTGPPANATLTVQSSTSILAEWDHSISTGNILFIRYRVVYQGKLFNTLLQYSDIITGTQFVLNNLSPYTLYSVYIESITPASTNQTNLLKATTFQAAPTESPQNVTAIPKDATSILITVHPPSPDHQNGPIRNYTITYRQQSLSDTGETQSIVIHISSVEAYPLVISSQIIAYSLQPFTHYTFDIIATNDAGVSPSVAVTARTDPAAPSQPPQNVTAYAYSATAIAISYYPPPSIDQNGIITSFKITIEGTPFDTEVDVTNVAVSTPVYPLVTSGNYLITQLHTYNTYSIKLTAVNSVGESGSSESISVTTLQSGLKRIESSPNERIFKYSVMNLQPANVKVPTESPQNVTAIPKDATSILITVHPPSPDHQNGPIRNYTITYQQQSLSDTGETQSIVIHISSVEAYPLVISSQIIADSLQPFTHYTFDIIAANDAGVSPSVAVTARTDPAAPSQPPQIITAYAYSATAIAISYYPPPSTDQNGIITSFKITIEGTPFDTEVDVINVAVSTPVYPLVTSGNYLITQLHAYNTYSIKLTAVNSVGESGSSESISVTTLQSAPTQSPQDPIAIALDSSSILLTCSPPSPIHQKGPIRNYTIYYQPESSITAVQTISLVVANNAVYPLEESSQITIPSLQPYTAYIITLIASNDAGSSPNVTISVRTDAAVPTESPQNVTAIPKDATSILITVRPPSPDHQNGPIRNYTITYQQQSLSDTGETQSIVIHISSVEAYPLVISSQIIADSLQPFTHYTFDIIAANDAGVSPSVAVTARTDPADSIPIITYPASNTTFSPTLSYTYTQIIVCTATGYPQPTVLWYNSDNEAITTGATLQLDASNVSNGRVYICKADNGLGFDSRSVEFSISDTQVDTEGILDEINDAISTTSEFDPNQVGNIAEIVANILPDTSNVPIRDVNNTKDLLKNGANTIEDLFDKITDNDTAITPGDAGKIANTAGDIINKDNELDRTIDNPTLSPEAINQGGIAFASNALIIALRTLDKVCRNLGRNNFKNEQIRDSFIVSSTFVSIYGDNIPIANILTEETFPINLNADNLQDSIAISRSSAVALAGNQISLKVVIAIVSKYGTIDASRQGTGPKQDSNIMLVVIPERTGTVPLAENATIIFSNTSNYPSNKVGSYLNDNLWSTNGITTELASRTSIELNVNHFTSFVVFANFPPPTSLLENYLAIASYTLSGISVLCLVSSLFLFIFSGKKGFFKIEINILYFNLCIALLISSLLFILYGLKPDVLGLGDLICKIVAGVIHYSWILTFAWCFAFAIYITYKINFGIKKNRKIYPYLIIFAWTFPLIFPILTLAIQFDVYVDYSKHCFPSKQEYILLSLLVPVIVLSLITIGMVIAMSIRFVSVKKRFDDDDDAIRVGIKHILLSTAILTCILTVPWIVLMVYFFVDNTLIEWVFVLLNDTMGIFFFIFIALRVREVRDLILCKSTQNIHETRENDVRPNAFHNPIYGGNVQNIMGDGSDGYDDLVHKSGADFFPHEAKEKQSFEMAVHKKSDEINYYNLHRLEASQSSYSTQMYDSDLPPIYDHVAINSQAVGFSNPIYETAAAEHTEGLYEELNFNNPFREDIDSQDLPTPIHPTGTQMGRENPFDI